MAIVMVVVGLVLLIAAGDFLVRGAVNLSLKLGVPALIVSLTVVAFGTSSPELVISVDAVLDGVPGIALGNVVGSNTANVLLVMGVPALISPIVMSDRESRVNYVLMLAASALFIALAFLGAFTWWSGVILLVALAAILTYQVRRSRRAGADVMPEEANPDISRGRIALFLLLGLVGLPLGARLLINGAQQIAETLGLSDAVIGLTVVAIGTSLPELATTVAAAFRKQASVAVGNVLGSNIFNLLAIIGIAAQFGQIPVEESFLRLDLWVMLGASVILAPFVFLGGRVGRLFGAMFCAAYVIYLWQVVV